MQATPEELLQLTSISSIQTKGLRKFFQEQEFDSKLKLTHPLQEQEIKLNSIKGAKRKRLQLLNDEDNNKKNNDPNVVGFETESDTSSDEYDDPENKKTKFDDENNSNNQTNEEVSSNVEAGQTEKEDVESNTIESKNQNETTNNIKSKVSEEKATIKSIERKPAVYVDVHRSKQIQNARLKLPILAEEQEIMETINESPVTIIAGETGNCNNN